MSTGRDFAGAMKVRGRFEDGKGRVSSLYWLSFRRCSIVRDSFCSYTKLGTGALKCFPVKVGPGNAVSSGLQ